MRCEAYFEMRSCMSTMSCDEILEYAAVLDAPGGPRPIGHGVIFYSVISPRRSEPSSAAMPMDIRSSTADPAAA